ncbi:MAG TPA: energy-dependent translational throttle protein EttA, partial [Usitatibacter sp.]|nr:energy-dependent translational throttle protein EttA [Usitatibacter sp.]
MAQYVYTMIRVGKVVPPKRQILKNISLSFHPGAKIGLLGLNGAGKSSVLKIMAGVDKDFEGEAHPMPNIRIGYLPQEPQLEPGHTVREAVEEGLGEVFQAKKRLEQVYAEYAEADADFDKLASEQEKLEKLLASADSDTLDTQLEVAADALRLPPWDAKVDVLSGGEKRRVALCRLLLSKPDMLLLDEPTNHLDAESVEWLEQYLQRFPGTVVAVTHDRYFLDNAAEWILELDRGTGIPYKGNYSEWLEQKRDRLQKEESSESARQKAIKRELEWVRRNAKGQQTKNTARLKRFEELNDYEYQKRNETAEIFIPVAERLGNEVIEFENVSKGYGDRLLIDNLSFKIPPGAIVGIIGPNGAGKSTLFRMITGKEKPDSGKITIGHTVKMSVVDQTRKFPEKKNVWEAISNGQDILTIGKFEIQSRAYLGRFNFRGSDQQKLTGQLSGGERGRLHLAKTLLDGGNVLLLDEPSNDLDVETLRALEDALQEFAGTV